LRTSGKKMAAVLPVHVPALHQSHINLVDESGSFVVNGRAFPSGEYKIRSERDIHVLRISGAGQSWGLFLATPCLSPKDPEASQQTKLVFYRYGDQYLLSEIWMKGNTVGHKLPKSRREEVEIAQDKMAQQVIVLAEVN
jgi:hypothetical protein